MAEAFRLAHARLRERLGDVLLALEQADAERAARLFHAWAFEMRRHCRLEELHLFGSFEAASGLRESGPTVLLRRDHSEIASRVARMLARLRGGEPEPRANGKPAGPLAAELSALRALLDDHRRREEDVLFPACDRLLDGDERGAILRALEGKD